jgi:hypothetical protein
MSLGRTVLGVVAIIFLSFGAWALLSPAAVAGLTQVVLTTPTALADGRAVYGGLTLGLALYFALCAMRRELVRAGLWAVLLTVGCAFLGRLAGVVADGADTSETFRTLASEFGITALAAVSLWRDRSRPAL